MIRHTPSLPKPLLITNLLAATAPAPQQPGMVHASGVNATATTGGMTASGVNSLRRAADEELKYNSEVCFLPIPGSSYDTATARGIAGFVGFAQGSNKICGVWRTVVEVRACLVPYVRDKWIHDVTIIHDRRMFRVPNSTLVLFDGSYLPPIGDPPW